MRSIVLFLSLLLSVSGLSLAQESEVRKIKQERLPLIVTQDGRRLINAYVLRWSATEARIGHENGITSIKVDDLPQRMRDSMAKILADHPELDMEAADKTKRALSDIARMERAAAAKGIVNGPTDDMRIEGDKTRDDYGWHGPIPGANPVNTYLGLQQKGFELKRRLGSVLAEWTCTQTAGLLDMSCTLLSKPGEITSLYSVKAMIQDSNAVPNVVEAAGFLGWVASLPYDQAEPETIKQWVSDQVLAGEDGAKVVGGVKFELHLRPRSRLLTIAKAP